MRDSTRGPDGNFSVPGSQDEEALAIMPLEEPENAHYGVENQKTTIRSLVDSKDNGIGRIINEMVQNALDSLVTKYRAARQHYTETEVKTFFNYEVWLIVDMREQLIRCIDTGLGMSAHQLKVIFEPGGTFKPGLEQIIGSRLSGFRGMGMTFLAFSTNRFRISSRLGANTICYELNGGRDWAYSKKDTPLPHLLPSEEDCEVYTELYDAAAVTVYLDDNDWIKEVEDSCWDIKYLHHFLRTSTPISNLGLFEDIEDFNELVSLKVIFVENDGQELYSDAVCRYPYPHLIEGISTVDISDCLIANHLSDDPYILPAVDGIFGFWDSFAFLHFDGYALNGYDYPHLIEADAVVYAFYARNSFLYDLISVMTSGQCGSCVPGTLICIGDDASDSYWENDEGYGGRLFLIIALDPDSYPNRSRIEISIKKEALLLYENFVKVLSRKFVFFEQGQSE